MERRSGFPAQTHPGRAGTSSATGLTLVGGDSHFRELREAHVNSTRVWISCNGDNASPGIDANGTVSAPTPAFWRDLDSLFTVAQENHIYLMLALISFDHSKPGNRNAEAWRRMYSSPKGRQSFVDNYTVPLVERYKESPWFFAIDVGNELVWTWENHKVARKDTLDLVARVANAVHAHSKVLVCEGEGAGPKYNSDKKLVALNTLASTCSPSSSARANSRPATGSS